MFEFFLNKKFLLFASCASNILENTLNPGDLNKLEKLKKNPIKFNNKFKALQLGKNNPTHHYELGGSQQERSLAERALGTWWMLC